MKRTILRCSLAAAIAMGSLPALAADAGSPSRYDHRIRTVEYNPMDTVKVDGVAGIATHIQVAPSERYVTHAFGESGGWAFSNVENNFFIRPKAVDSNTNLTIITDKRTYHFLLRYIDSYTIEENGQEVEKFIEVPWTMRAATVGVRFEYPFEDAQEEHQEQERQRIQDALNERDPQGPVNMQYRMSNDPDSQEIAPTNAWDDYTHTYFKFPRNAALPTIFAINANGEESLVNATIEGEHNNVMVVQQVAREWRIRYGDRVVGIINDGYNPSLGGHENGTTSPNVRRVIRQGGEE